MQTVSLVPYRKPYGSHTVTTSCFSVSSKLVSNKLPVTVKINKSSVIRESCHKALARPSIKHVKPFVIAETKSPSPSIFLATFLAAPFLIPLTAFWIPVIVLVMLLIFPVRTFTKVSVKP